MRNPKSLKGKNWSFAHQGCLGCVHKNDCVRCSSLNQPNRQILLAFLGFRKKQNKAMADGIAQHELHFKDQKELDQYGVKQFYSDLYTGKDIFIKEANVCSPSHGLRGHIDGLKLSYNPKEKKFFFEIQELKPKWSRSYLMQLAGYALILSDPYCQIIYKKVVRKEHHIPRKLYLQHPINITAMGKFIYYKMDNKEYCMELINNNQISPITNGLYSRLKKIRTFMKAGVFYLSDLKECPWCSNECEFYSVCSKYPYSKDKQRYLGRTKLLRKSKVLR